MASSTKLNVVVAGASGETGSSIMKALLAEPAQFHVIALARPESAGKPAYREMSSSGTTIKAGDFRDVDTLAEQLAGADVVISCILPIQRVESETLIDAAHRAGVGRFLPSFWGPVMPPRGIMAVRDLREDLLDRCKRLYLPYTVVDVGMWYQVCLPEPYAPEPPIADVFIGVGNTPTAIMDKEDIGPYIARIITDPRTLNRSVLAYGEVTTQSTIWAEVEAAMGKEIPRNSVSIPDLEARIAELQGPVTRNPTDVGLLLELAMSQYRHTRYVRGDNTPEHAQYLGYLDGKSLYSDLNCKSVRDFIREVVSGERDHRIYVGRDPVADATQHRT
ncbi:isoflavone reductase P3 [Fusarium tjaetaba]|uniref:Isoflavone reductase P3 n=1 Tax=Fusarium tjaetaba TaxID=1567544 RepID=A0A8H5W7H7_9HYPO|nr:isoflavone reductase P3 [Fusarium tjaetaba]KAF5647854.1 isoflavone reductase P3 [Fusarium tjaetaba]